MRTRGRKESKVCSFLQVYILYGRPRAWPYVTRKERQWKSIDHDNNKNNSVVAQVNVSETSTCKRAMDSYELQVNKHLNNDERVDLPILWSQLNLNN